MSADIKTILLNVAVVSATAGTVIKIVLLEYESVRRVMDRVFKLNRAGSTRLGNGGREGKHGWRFRFWAGGDAERLISESGAIYKRKGQPEGPQHRHGERTTSPPCHVLNPFRDCVTGGGNRRHTET